MDKRCPEISQSHAISTSPPYRIVESLSFILAIELSLSRDTSEFMEDTSPPSLKCNSCGHTWKARSRSPKSPQCSKCRSRDIERIGVDVRRNSNMSPQSSPPANRDEVLNRLIRDFKALVYHLRGIEVMDDESFYSQLITFCPFCNASQEDGMEYDEEARRWICRRCGARV